MKRVFILAILVFLLVLWFGGPLLENIDPWDIFPDIGDQAILVLTAAAALLGATFCLAVVVFILFRPIGIGRHLLIPVPTEDTGAPCTALDPFLELSPPLRI